MDWFILGIDPTKDKKAITAAYRQKLRQTNPEDKPEEFKALRNAYEEAIALADRADTAPVRDESPVGLWISAIAELYEDFPARQDPQRWQALLADDVCAGLDTRPAAEEALLKFLMEHFYLPREVWQALDNAFAFSQRAEELYEIWPRDFIDHGVLSGIRNGCALDCRLFTPGRSGTDCDAYCHLYFQANQTPLDQLAPIIARMDALSESHPFGEVLRFLFYRETGRQEECTEGLRQLATAYPDVAPLVLLWANLCLENNDTEEAEGIANHILELQPENPDAKLIYARCLAEKQQYHQAKELAYEVQHADLETPAIANQAAEYIKLWNNELIRTREARFAEAPEDYDNAIELAWCYAQNERVEEAIALAEKIDPNCPDAFGYHNLFAKLYHNTNKYAEALTHLQTVEHVLRNMTDDGTSKTRKRMARLPEMLQVQASCLMQLGQTTAAMEKFEQALAESPEDAELLSTMAKILFRSGDYAYTLEISQRLCRVVPNAGIGLFLSALSLYRLYREQEAFNAVEYALSSQSTDLNLYVLKMQILVQNKLFAEVHELLDFFRESNVPEDISLDFIRAELTELENQDLPSALKQYQALAKRVEAGEPLLYECELYYRLALLTGKKHNDLQAILTIIDKGLAANREDRDLLGYKAWLLQKTGAQEDAIAMYRRILETNPNSTVALRGIADLYYEDLPLYARDALTYYEKILESQKSAALYFYAATCKRYLGDWDGARLYYLKELEMDPDDLDGYQGLAYILEAQGNRQQALEQLNRALTIMAEYNKCYDTIIEHKLKLLRRTAQYEEALAFAREAATQYQYNDSLQQQFDICCQAGLWEQAKQVLSRWKAAERNNPARLFAQGQLNLLQAQMFRAVLAMGRVKHKLPYHQVQEFRLQLADLECNLSRQNQLLCQQVQQDPQDHRALLRLAHTYYLLEKQPAARGAARKALEMLDSILTRSLTDEPLYRTRRCLALAILGDIQGAKAELATARALPLCDFCPYSRCKDADIYEAYIEELLGNTEEAERLYAAGKANWPDELDFITGLLRLKKGRK